VVQELLGTPSVATTKLRTYSTVGAVRACPADLHGTQRTDLPMGRGTCGWAPAGDCAAQRGSPGRAVRGAPALHWSDVDLHAGLRLRWLLTCPAARERQSLARRAADVPVSRFSP
jgi:hypothetical protein